ncbi:MAG: tRNA pseudouridine(55) synthase TruB [Dehalococcoidia bacterium]
MDGFLNVDKSPGWTSFDVVAFVRRESGVRRVGHGGTLDPAAEGVLVIALGQATRFLEYLLEARKSYRARVRLGVVTDTYDGEGEVVRTADPSSVTREMVESAVAGFRGVISQVPPMFSALKRDGVPLYKHARAKQEIEREARTVEVYRLEMVDFAPPSLAVEIECGHGFYVRSLAYDLGERLGCGAHLEKLTRTAVGPFERGSSVGMEALREAFRDGSWQQLLLPLDSVLLHCYAAILGEGNESELRFGRALNLQPADEERTRSLSSGTACRAYSVDGRLLGLLSYADDAVWQPKKVLSGSQGV